MKIKLLFIIFLSLLLNIIFLPNNRYSFTINRIEFHDDNENDVEIKKIYLDNNEIIKIPTKSETIEFEKGECTNNASVSWNYEAWSLVFDTLENNTSCAIYFKTKTAAEYSNNISDTTTNESNDSLNNPATGSFLNVFLMISMMIIALGGFIYYFNKRKFMRL